MAANYVKFRRGTPKEFELLKVKDSDTLYFISRPEDDFGSLYLGTKLIAGGIEAGDCAFSSLKHLQDVLIGADLADRHILIYDEEADSWVNRALLEALPRFIGATVSSTGVAGLVPAPGEGQTNLFLRSDGRWVDIPNQQLKVNEKVFEFDSVTEKLNLIGFEQAAQNSTLSKNSDGSLSWNIIDSYTKEETDKAIAQAVETGARLKRKIVNSVIEIQDYIDTHDDAEQYIFMIPIPSEDDNNKYEEYFVVITSDDIGNKITSIEKVGSSISGDYVTVSKLEELLNGKVDKQEGYTLLSPEDQNKLNALKLDENGNITGIGPVNATEVEGLADWISNNAGIIPGLSENNLTNDLANKLNQSLFIRTVESTELKLSEEGVLSIGEIAPNQVTGLEEMLRSKATAEQVNTLQVKIDDISSSLDDQKQAINEIKETLTWKDM